MTARIRRRLEQAALEQRGILFGFLPAGYPDPERFQTVTRAAFEAGLDALEVSMPGPAPMLDGDLIRAAAEQAAQHMHSIPEALHLAARSRSNDDDTIIAMAYATLFDSISPDGFLDALVDADVDAFLLPQHPVAEQLDLGIRAQARGIEPIVFLHREEDLTLLSTTDLETPIIYLQSADLRTGGAFSPAKAEERLGELAEAMGDKGYKVCVGFGVRGFDEAVPLMEAGADGIIIGTRLVKAAAAGPGEVTDIIDEVAPALVRREELRS